MGKIFTILYERKFWRNYNTGENMFYIKAMILSIQSKKQYKTNSNVLKLFSQSQDLSPVKNLWLFTHEGLNTLITDC